MDGFREVMRQWKRMCMNYTHCIDCPMSDKQTCIVPMKYELEIDFDAACEIIMSWAAEHPEQIYPTWEEWLIAQGVIKENPNGVGWPMPKLLERIDADTAEKLGIKPKEGT